MRAVLVAIGAMLLLPGCCCRVACRVGPGRPAPGPAAPVAPPPPAAPAKAPTAPEPAAVGPAAAPAPAERSPVASSSASGRRLAVALSRTTSLTMSGTAQVTLSNATSITLDLYVDGGYGCRALRNLMCTTHVTPGTITLEARGPDGESASATTTVSAGDSVTWTVTEE